MHDGVFFIQKIVSLQLSRHGCQEMKSFMNPGKTSYT